MYFPHVCKSQPFFEPRVGTLSILRPYTLLMGVDLVARCRVLDGCCGREGPVSRDGEQRKSRHVQSGHVLLYQSQDEE